jgi:hypothetical protein
MDAVDLAMFRDHCYDFVLSCHSLEHIANPVSPTTIHVIRFSMRQFSFSVREISPMVLHCIHETSSMRSRGSKTFIATQR